MPTYGFITFLQLPCQPMDISLLYSCHGNIDTSYFYNYNAKYEYSTFLQLPCQHMDTPLFYNYHVNIWIHHLSTITIPTYEYNTFLRIPCQHMNAPLFYNYHVKIWIYHSLQLPCQHMNTSLSTITIPTYEYITHYNYLPTIGELTPENYNYHANIWIHHSP